MVVLVEEGERLSIFLESDRTCPAGAQKFDETSFSWEGSLEKRSSRVVVVLSVNDAVSILLGSMPLGAICMRSALCGDCRIVCVFRARSSSADVAWSVTSFPYFYTHGREIYQCTDFGTVTSPTEIIGPYSYAMKFPQRPVT